MRALRLTPLFFLAAFAGAALPARSAEVGRVDQDLKIYDERVAALNAAFDSREADPKDKEWIKAKLAHMVEVDQYMRNYADTPRLHGYDKDETADFNKRFIGERWTALDLRNTEELKKLLKLHRWFTIGEFGKAADDAAWLIVQHADHDPAFQKSVLRVLDGLWSKGETDPAHYAYLFDRVAASFHDQSKRRLLRYGTQGGCAGPGKWEPLPVEKPAQLDRRRAAVGLGPEADYIKNFVNACH